MIECCYTRLPVNPDFAKGTRYDTSVHPSSICEVVNAIVKIEPSWRVKSSAYYESDHVAIVPVILSILHVCASFLFKVFLDCCEHQGEKKSFSLNKFSSKQLIA